MRQVNIHQAKTHLSRLVQAVGNGIEIEIVIAKAGKPVARLVPVGAIAGPRTLGILAGQLTVPLDFDQPLPREILDGFEGGADATAG